MSTLRTKARGFSAARGGCREREEKWESVRGKVYLSLSPSPRVSFFMFSSPLWVCLCVCVYGCTVFSCCIVCLSCTAEWLKINQVPAGSLKIGEIGPLTVFSICTAVQCCTVFQKKCVPAAATQPFKCQLFFVLFLAIFLIFNCHCQLEWFIIVFYFDYYDDHDNCHWLCFSTEKETTTFTNNQTDRKRRQYISKNVPSAIGVCYYLATFNY